MLSPCSEELCCGLPVILPEQHVCWAGKWDLLCSHTSLCLSFSFHLIQLGWLSHFPGSGAQRRAESQPRQILGTTRML